MAPLPRPPFDPELAAVHGYFPSRGPITKEQMVAWHKDPSELMLPTAEDILARRPLTHAEYKIPALLSEDPEIILSVFTPKEKLSPDGPSPCLYFMHGGGLVIGDRFTGVVEVLDWITDTDCTLVTVEYRLGPENPQPAMLNDSYAGLAWVHANAEKLAIDPKRIVIGGHSGGACLAAGLAMMARDRDDGPPVCGQLLASPMLDNRIVSNSMWQFATDEPWLRASSSAAWSAALAQDEAEGEGANPKHDYYVPNRAKNLQGLPPAWIDVGTCDVVRDEAVEYASRLWAAGVRADLRVWAGAYHGFELIAPKARVSYEAYRGRNEWVKHIVNKSQ